MGVSNYTELKATIADFLNRTDLTSVIPTFITLAEADFNRRIRHYSMEARATAELNTQFFLPPADWLESIRFRLTGDGTYPLELVSNSQLMDMRDNSNDAAGRPGYYVFVDGQFELFPTPSQAYTAELIYYAKIPALSDSATTNWLLTNHPDSYLYASLMHSAPYLQEDARTQIWAGLAERAVADVNSASQSAKLSGSGLTMKKRGLAPASRS